MAPRGGHFARLLLVLSLVLLAAAHPPPPAAFAEESSPYSKALAAYQDRRLKDAFTYAKEAVRQEPEHVDAQVLLGELYYQRQDLGRAKESWQRALKLAPSRQDVRDRLEKLEREAKVESGFARNDTAPFVVRFAEGEVPASLTDLREFLLETYRLVGQQMGYFPNHPITVLIYPAEGFKQVQGLSHQTAGLYDGKIRLPLRDGEGADLELKRVFWHEYTHALVHDLAKGKCPVWLNEGIATLQEARVLPINLQPVREAYEGKKLIPWDQLWKEEYAQGELELHYAQAYSIAQYLAKRWGFRKLESLLNRLGEGYPLADAFRAEYRMAPAAIEKEWLTWLRRNL
ncbi:MAG: tetratricopeptide repeat protein [Candidatus Omnitrophica bacterium]|nr:tetratricopeptide repeat protein [Candidatus Omnitrophota bacterium]